MSDKVIDASEYLKGCNDCKEGLEPRLGEHDDYYLGFALQYEREQVLTELNIKQETIH
jgi:hypothetical protein